MGGFNDLATLLPDIAAEWSDRNYPLLPTQVTVFANRKAWWKCKDCGREWNTLISTRCKLWDAGEKGLTLSAFEWEKDRKTLIYGQVDYMYGEALYKPEMKEEYHILICKMRLGKPVQANGCLSYRALGIWQEHLFLHIMPKSVILSSQHREAETVGGLPSRRRVFSHDYIFRIVSILFIARRCHQSGNSDWT